MRSLCVVTLLMLAACSHDGDVKNVEAHQVETLSYTAQVDTTRIVRGTGLGPTAALAALVEESLATYFKVQKNTGNDEKREVVGEAPAPGYGVRVVIEARPDLFCFVAIDVVHLANLEPVAAAPYSVHVGVGALRDALSVLHAPNRPPLTQQRFDALRAQAAALAKRNGDSPMDAASFVHAPRPLEDLNGPPVYYAPSDEPSTLRGQH